jgi:hypothetical protein
VKKSKIAIFIIAFIVVSIIAVALGIKLSKTIIYAYFGIVAAISIIGFIIWKIVSRKEMPEFRDGKDSKKVNFNEKDCMKMLDKELKSKLILDKIDELIRKGMVMIGTEGSESPVFYAKFFGKGWSCSERIKYMFLFNMNDGKNVLLLKERSQSDKEFDDETRQERNKIANFPQYIDTSETEFRVDPITGKPIKIVRNRKETKEQKDLREQEQAEKKAEEMGE